MLGKKVVSIIIPVFNEEKTIYKLLLELSRQKFPGWEKELVVIDDASKDNSWTEIIKAKDVFARKKPILLRQSQNLGKGAALATGLKRVTGNVVVIQDADLEYHPREIAKMLKEYTLANPAVYGSRNLSPRQVGYKLYLWGDVVLTKLANLFYGSNLTDIYTGYKLVDTKLLKSLGLESKGFEIEMEMTLKMLERGINIIEIPIRYYPRTFKEGKKLKLKDGLKGLQFFLIYLLKRKA